MGKHFFIRIMRLIFLFKMVYNMLTLTFNFKVKLGVNQCKNWFSQQIFLIGGGEKFFVFNMCTDRKLLMVCNMLTLTFIFKIK